MYAWDIGTVRALNSWAGSSLLNGTLAVAAAEAVIWIMGAILAMAAFLQMRRSRHMTDVRLAVRAIFAFGAGMLANHLFSLFLFRPRPFVSFPDVINLIAKSPASKSFPSDHATAAFALAFVTASQPGLFAVLLVLAVIVSLGRVAVGVHFPTDVLTGAAVGYLWATAAKALDRSRFMKRFWAAAAKAIGLKL